MYIRKMSDGNVVKGAGGRNGITVLRSTVLNLKWYSVI